jgi:hypothetical protein
MAEDNTAIPPTATESGRGLITPPSSAAVLSEGVDDGPGLGTK